MNVWRNILRRKGFRSVNLGLVSVTVWLGAGVAVAEPVKILALGDSLTAGYGLVKEDAFTSQLQRALKADGLDVTVINAGVSGDTSAGGRARLGWALADKPEAIIIELGANDGLRGLEPAETERNLDAIVGEVKARGLAVLLSGMMAPPNLGKEYGAKFNAIYPKLAKKHGVLFDPFFLEGVAADPALNQADRVHPNVEGVQVIVNRLVPVVRELVARAQKQ